MLCLDTTVNILRLNLFMIVALPGAFQKQVNRNKASCLLRCEEDSSKDTVSVLFQLLSKVWSRDTSHIGQENFMISLPVIGAAVPLHNLFYTLFNIFLKLISLVKPVPSTF